MCKPLRALSALLRKRHLHTHSRLSGTRFPEMNPGHTEVSVQRYEGTEPQVLPHVSHLQAHKNAEGDKEKILTSGGRVPQSCAVPKVGGLSRKPYPTSPFFQMKTVMIREVNFFFFLREVSELFSGRSRAPTLTIPSLKIPGKNLNVPQRKKGDI